MGALISTFWNAVRTAFNQSFTHARSPPRVPDQNGASPDPYDPSPRVGYLSKDDYFMAVAFLSAQRSKDPNRQVGSCIVDDKDVILGIGYNGFPRGCPDTSLPWAKSSKSEDPLQTKYPFVVHAEANAILNKNNADLTNTRMFVTLFPCNECAKLLIQAGIKEVIYHEAKQGKDAEMYEASRIMFRMAGIKTRRHVGNKKITIEI